MDRFFLREEREREREKERKRKRRGRERTGDVPTVGPKKLRFVH